VAARHNLPGTELGAGEALGINARGQIVGSTSTLPAPSPAFPRTAVIWG
jgi:hypothetical protein